MGVDRLIYIRTDGNSQIASGHLVRCFSVALACRKLGMGVRFLVSDEESLALLENTFVSDLETAFPIIRLKTAAYNNLEQELSEVISLLASSSLSASQPAEGKYDTPVMNENIVYFLDSYYVTEKYLLALRPYVKIAYLDDLQLFDYPVNLLINYDVIPDTHMPSCKAAYQNAEKLLLGASYTPLRSQFQNKKITVRENVSDILVTTGGSDPYHFCLNFIEKINSFSALWSMTKVSDVTFHVVVGRLNTDREKLRELALLNCFAEPDTKSPRIQLHENVSDMASLMIRCDLAVSAAGTTLYELCALGIPAISFTMADNQLAAASAFDAVGAIPLAGDIRSSSKRVFQMIADFMTQMSQNSFVQRKTVHETMRKLVDGDGALRIARALSEL